MKPLEDILAASAALHHHLCPRQVLGARIGSYAGELLGLELPREDKRLLAIVETDGCAVDGISAATGCRVGRRTMRIVDFGKVAGVFVDTATEQAVRVVPRPGCREAAWQYARRPRSRWEAQLIGYQQMPDRLLLRAQSVRLSTSLEALLSRPGRKTTCEICAEEIMNDRQIIHEGTTLCAGCAGEAYYRIAPVLAPAIAAID